MKTIVELFDALAQKFDAMPTAHLTPYVVAAIMRAPETQTPFAEAMASKERDFLLSEHTNLQMQGMVEKHLAERDAALAMCEQLKAQIVASKPAIEAARNFVAVKGRFHTEQAYKRLEDAVKDLK